MPAYQLTLADTNAHQLSALIAAVNPQERVTGWNTIILQASPGNAASSTIGVGDAAIATNGPGMELGVGVFAPKLDSGMGVDRQSTSEVWVKASTGSLKLDVYLYAL